MVRNAEPGVSALKGSDTSFSPFPTLPKGIRASGSPFRRARKAIWEGLERPIDSSAADSFNSEASKACTLWPFPGDRNSFGLARTSCCPRIFFRTGTALWAINGCYGRMFRRSGDWTFLCGDLCDFGLAGAPRWARPALLPVLLGLWRVSGYAEGLAEKQLPPNSAFLQKPFRFATLLEQLKLVQRKP